MSLVFYLFDGVLDEVLFPSTVFDKFPDSVVAFALDKHSLGISEGINKVVSMGLGVFEVDEDLRSLFSSFVASVNGGVERAHS